MRNLDRVARAGRAMVLTLGKPTLQKLSCQLEGLANRAASQYKAPCKMLLSLSS